MGSGLERDTGGDSAGSDINHLRREESIPDSFGNPIGPVFTPAFTLAVLIWILQHCSQM